MPRAPRRRSTALRPRAHFAGMLHAWTPEFEPLPLLPVARARICLWSKHVTLFPAGLETRSGEYSGFGTAQGARQIGEQRKAPADSVRRQAAGANAKRQPVKGDNARHQTAGDRTRRQVKRDASVSESPGGGELGTAPGGKRWRTAPAGETEERNFGARRRAVRRVVQDSVRRWAV
eukprot:6190006-Pleurochrysis_carterae.AAC.3